MDVLIYPIISLSYIAQSAGAVEYTNYASVEE